MRNASRMLNQTILFLAAALFLACAFERSICAQIVSQKTSVYEFVNGNWFDGKMFKRRTLYSVNGVFAAKRPTKIDESVDLKNGFVIPPFGDAHTHNLDGKYNLDKMIGAYLAEGTFYVQVLTNSQTGAAEAKPFLNKPESLDVIYAHGGLTSMFGHPFLAYEPRAQGFYSWAETQANLEKIKQKRIVENDAYWFFDSIADVDAKWNKFLAGKPDIVKIYLLDAANQSKLKIDDNIGGKGLLPEVAEYIVKRAHAANLRVFAHVETADDFRLGIRIGVDGFAHLPGYGYDGSVDSAARYELTAADFKLAVQKRIVIIPTLDIGKSRGGYWDNKTGVFTPDENRTQNILARQKRMVELMRQTGVRIALGSDGYGSTLDGELRHIYENKMLDNKTLLKIAVETTTQTIFPNRKIGRLREGYEASFLVLKGNPLEDFNQVKNIELRFKQGSFIE